MILESLLARERERESTWSLEVWEWISFRRREQQRLSHGLRRRRFLCGRLQGRTPPGTNGRPVRSFSLRLEVLQSLKTKKKKVSPLWKFVYLFIYFFGFCFEWQALILAHTFNSYAFFYWQTIYMLESALILYTAEVPLKFSPEHYDQTHVYIHFHVFDIIRSIN